MTPTDVKYVTLSYDGTQGDREFVLACKGRPFAVLTAPSFPTPAVTLVDYNLVRDMKLRMSDLQCAKFHYAGQKMRILGKISTSVQCITSGAISGNIHFKAMVIQDLYQNFDVHSIAGVKLSQKLIGPPYEELSPESEPMTPPRKKEKKPRKETNKASPSSSSQLPSMATLPYPQGSASHDNPHPTVCLLVPPPRRSHLLGSHHPGTHIVCTPTYPCSLPTRGPLSVSTSLV